MESSASGLAPPASAPPRRGEGLAFFFQSAVFFQSRMFFFQSPLFCHVAHYYFYFFVPVSFTCGLDFVVSYLHLTRPTIFSL